MGVREINGSVDGNGSVARFLFALVFFTSDEGAGQPLEESFGAALRFDVSNRSGDGNIGLALENVESGRSKFTFSANNFAFTKAAPDNSPAIELEESAGDAFENGDPQELLGFESLRVRAGSDRGADNTFVGERACGARNHALAAGNARGIPHRGIEIEGDADRISFAHAAENEIVFDFVAAADATVAQDTGVVVHGDGQGGIVFAASDTAFHEAV